MPQLNPSPWMLILFFSWLVFITILPLKIMTFEYPDKLTEDMVEYLIMAAWNWPW